MPSGCVCGGGGRELGAAAIGRENPPPHCLHLGGSRWCSHLTSKARSSSGEQCVLREDSAKEHPQEMLSGECTPARPDLSSV